MKRTCGKSAYRKILLIPLLAFIIIMAGCGKESNFSGSKTGNDRQFLVDFSILNTTVENNMPLTEGDKVQVVIDIKKGSVDVVIKNENGTTAYQGNDAENSKFTIEIQESGTYTFSVTGKKAKGSVHFKKS